jgi:hypothetical protein
LSSAFDNQSRNLVAFTTETHLRCRKGTGYESSFEKIGVLSKETIRSVSTNNKGDESHGSGNRKDADTS